MAKTILHKADTRGHADHGWLNSYHTFSFAGYYDPQRTHFGVLRVLNDDTVKGGMGFGTHAHDNMEIISIPLEGELEHKDSMGTVAVIRKGDIQVMSAGTGVRHSEYNKSKDQPVKFLQIWIFPDKRNVVPRYGQATLKAEDRHNKFQQIVSPGNDSNGVWIHQQAWFYLGKFDSGTATTHRVKKEGNGLYVFVLSGTVKVNGESLGPRDGYGIWETDVVDFQANSECEILLMDVPMN